MKIWFIRHNNESLGPYTIEELKNLAVTKDDYVWKEGFTDWIQAKDINELNVLFAKPSPPPFTQKQTSLAISEPAEYKHQNIEDRFEKAGRKIGKLMRWTAITIIIIGILTFIYYKNQTNSYVSPFTTQKSAEELKVDLAQTEKQNPTNYISGKARGRQNLINQTVIEGTLTNSATLAAFKDVTLEVDFLSKTNSIISTQNVTVYEQINPGQTITFKEKIFVSKDVADVNIRIAGATPAN